LDAEQATRLVNPLLETMVELMVRYGGRIDRFLGDGVLAVFGVPAAHEDDPIRAVRAAMELKERATELGLAVTAGVNTGRVYFGPVGSDLHEELTVMGPTVNLAARFQGKADAGEVIVGASTATHLAAAFELTPLTLQIKGIAEPVPAFTATRLLDHPDKVRGIEGLRAGLVGRDAELERLRNGLGRTMAVFGDAGVGKSRLAAEFRQFVEAEGGLWLEGRGLQLAETTAYGPVVDLFRRHLGPEPVTPLRSNLDQLVDAGDLEPKRREEIEPFLVHLLGSSLGDQRDTQVTESDPEQRLALTADAVAAYLAAMAASQRVVVFFDDLHWSDPLSHAVIRTVGERLHGQITLLLASRPGFDLASVAPPEAVERIDLAELSADDTRHLARTLLEISGIPAWLETAILNRASGNPFYLEELIRSLIQRGQITRVDGQWTVTSPDVEVELPESVEALLMSRVDRLPDPTRRAARAASVLDRTFTTEVFGQLAPGSTGELGLLAGAGILKSEGDGYTFVHALTRQAIYSSLLPSQRSELHERAGRVLAAADADLDQIAHHYAQSLNHPKAVEFLSRAGDQALESYSTDTAQTHLERALARTEDLDEADRSAWRWKINASLGEVFERMARHAEARRHLHAALDEMPPDPVAMARAWRFIGMAHRLEGAMDEAHEALDRAEQVLEDTPDPDDAALRQEWIRVQKERAFALYFGGRGRELPAHNAQLTPVVEQYGTAAQLADHLYGQVLASFVDDAFVVPAETVAMARRALGIAEVEASPGRVAEGRFAL
ncbi:MAG: AAA family ATPase, partial [Acidimicrobiia bacterium]|nr:AAA family ATPase [Acidimicrobiia bacterium]